MGFRVWSLRVRRISALGKEPLASVEAHVCCCAPPLSLSLATLFVLKPKPLRACSRAKVNRTSVTMVGGDQRCESQVASLKRMLRRCNMLGRSSSKSSRCHIDGLSSRFLTKAPGASEDSRRSGGVSELLPRQCLTEGSLGADLRLGCRGTLNTQKWARRVCWLCQHFVHFHLQNFAVP